jgi:hypothetical protein
MGLLRTSLWFFITGAMHRIHTTWSVVGSCRKSQWTDVLHLWHTEQPWFRTAAEPF